MDIRQKLGKVVLWGVGVTSIAVTPFFSYDPINVPRFMAISIFGLVAFLLVLGNIKLFAEKQSRWILYVGFGFIAWSFISLVLSKINLTEGVFGVTGRQTGFITYLSLIGLMLVGVLSSSKTLMERISSVLVAIGTASALYGVIQSLGADLFDWINPYSPVFGFFGNPNFQASFMGIAAASAVALSFGKSLKILSRAGLLGFVVLALFNIYKSKSQQGYLVFIAGVAVVGYLYLRSNSKLKSLKVPYLAGAGFGFVAVVADILQKAPWSSILYKESVSFRGDFWRAGWKMTLDYPIFGVGLDGYRDHYRASRDLLTAMRPGSDASTDSAHNVFLDISSGGGFPLLVIYILIIGLVIFSAIKVIRRSTEFNVGFAAVFAAWVAYMAQSLISINQLGLAVWGWVLSGLIIGYEINTREGVVSNSKSVKQNSAYTNVAIGLGVIIALGISLPLMIADGNFRGTVKSGDVLKIEASTRQWPQSVTRMTYVAQILREGKLPDRSVVIAREAVKFNPSNYEAWRELSLQPNISEAERTKALATMKKLDPFNPNLK